MAQHGLSIAKASLLAACLRPDVTKISRDDLNHFHDTLQITISRCTPSNIQTIKHWLLEHIIPSPSRSAALSKYLVSTSKYLNENEKSSNERKSFRQQLHILYILNDVLHHMKYHSRNAAKGNNLVDSSGSALIDLFRYPAAERKSRTMKRLHDLLDIWEEEKYYSKEVIQSVRQNLTSKSIVHPTTQDVTKTASSKELSWNMPTTHGDPSAPFFDLPAANLMPHVVPNVSTPIRPDRVRALYLSSGPADESLVNAVKDFLKDVNSINDPFKAVDDEGIVADFDELGQLSYKNEAGDTVGDTYYGWSRAFCEKMKSRETEGQRETRGRSRSSSDHSRSVEFRKRRKYSTSRSRSRSYSDSQSPNGRGIHEDGRRSASRRSRSRSYSPERVTRQEATPSLGYAPPAQNAPFHIAFPPPIIGVHGFPVPPPKPPNWQGPWPPPPPPPPAGSGFNGFANHPYPPPNIPDQSRRPGHPHSDHYGFGGR